MAKHVTSEPGHGTLESMDTPIEKKQRVYEVGFLLSPAVQAEAVGGETASLKTIITDHQGDILSEGDPEHIDLAYPIERVRNNAKEIFDQGYFGWIKFSVHPEQIARIKDLLDKVQSMIRYLIITTVEENTIVSKKPLSKILRKEKRDLDESPESPVDASTEPREEAKKPDEKDEETLDEAIDEMVEGGEESDSSSDES